MRLWNGLFCPSPVLGWYSELNRFSRDTNPEKFKVRKLKLYCAALGHDLIKETPSRLRQTGTIIDTSDNYLIQESGGVNQTMHKKNFAQCLTQTQLIQ